jgi:hypothetical protein
MKAINCFHFVRDSLMLKPQYSAVSIAKRKRSKYAHVRPPLPLASDLALMQFTGGGNIETHIKRIMEEQAKAVGGSRGISVGIADVYRDSNGGIWWDADEEVEYAHLLDGVDKVKAEDDAEEALWEDFETSPASLAERLSSKNRSWGHDRRSSGESTDSGLDLKYLIPSPEIDSYPTFTSGELNDRVLASTRVGGEHMTALSLPSRPSRRVRHLFRSVSLVDLQAFGEPERCHNLSSPSARISSDRTPGDARVRDQNPECAVRRRRVPRSWRVPASVPASGVHFEIDALRMQFIKDSFTPSPSMTSTLPLRRSHSDSSSITSKISRSWTTKKAVKYPSSTFSIRTLFRK